MSSHGPLAGVTVVENASYISGPFAGLLLAQLGADVVKVEAPVSGDPFRRWGGTSSARRTRPQFASLNVGKRSVCTDLREPEGKAAYLDLVADADAVVENFRPGTLDRLFVGEAAVRRRRPGIVYVTITGFGPVGPYAGRPAYDAIVQAVSGLWSLLTPLQHQQPVGPPVSDAMAGLNAALAVAAGLAGQARSRSTGEADPPLRLDVSMLAASLNLFGSTLANHAETGEVETPWSRGRRSHSMAFRASDGATLAVHLSSPEKFWVRLTDVVERPGLRDDPRFATYPQRLVHFEELLAELSQAFAVHPRSCWLERLHAADVPAAPVHTVDEVAADEHVRAAGLLVRARGPAGESVLVPRAAISFVGDELACSLDVPALGVPPDPG